MPLINICSLVSLQAVLADTQEQLQGVQERCDRLIEEDVVGMLVSVFGRYVESTLTLVQRREVSEQEEQVRWLREKTGVLRARASGSASLSMFHMAFLNSSITAAEEIERRRGLIIRRKEILQQAHALHERDQQALIDQQDEIVEERWATAVNHISSIYKVCRQKHAVLIASLVPVRTTLLQTLSSIFPIEPLEPKDLLFNIVTVPLPVPLSSSEPAPPVSLPGKPSFNDETVASALGLVAQVVQLVSAYMGYVLTYPVTCVGSRSLIKDPISAMMGPRKLVLLFSTLMVGSRSPTSFPLYLKGVDTYRFEYGVFLLNKNIEMVNNSFHYKPSSDPCDS